MFKRVLDVRTWRFCGCELVNLVDLMNLKGLTYVGGSPSPFIDEGGGFTSEGVRVRMLFSLVAHADGYMIMVDAHNIVDVTVECQMHVGGCIAFFRNGRCWYLQILLKPRGM